MIATHYALLLTPFFRWTPYLTFSDQISSRRGRQPWLSRQTSTRSPWNQRQTIWINVEGFGGGWWNETETRWCMLKAAMWLCYRNTSRSKGTGNNVVQSIVFGRSVWGLFANKAVEAMCVNKENHSGTDVGYKVANQVSNQHQLSPPHDQISGRQMLSARQRANLHCEETTQQKRHKTPGSDCTVLKRCLTNYISSHNHSE